MYIRYKIIYMNNFNVQKPYNSLPLLPTEFDFNDIEILKKVNSANKALAELSAYLLALPNPYLLIEPMTVREAVASSEIENIHTTVSEVFQAELLPDMTMTTEQKETLHYKDALLYGFKYVQQKRFLHTNAYSDIQHRIEPSKPGLRKIPGTAIKNGLTGETIYTPPEGEKVIKDLLKNYEMYYNQTAAELDPDVLIRMAVLHYQFEAIHPFYDGNGRTGRILMVLYLVLQDVMRYPVLFISGYINEHKSTYYQTLRQVTEQGNWKPLVLFILEAVRQQSSKTTASLLEFKSIEQGIGAVFQNQTLRGNTHAFVQYLMTKPFYTQTDAAKRTGFNRLTVTKYLGILQDAGMLQTMKVKKYTVYYNQKLLEALQ